MIWAASNETVYFRIRYSDDYATQQDIEDRMYSMVNWGKWDLLAKCEARHKPQFHVVWNIQMAHKGAGIGEVLPPDVTVVADSCLGETDKNK